MDEEQPVLSKKKEIKMVELKNITNMTNDEVDEYAKVLWAKLTIDRGREGGVR